MTLNSPHDLHMIRDDLRGMIINLVSHVLKNPPSTGVAEGFGFGFPQRRGVTGARVLEVWIWISVGIKDH